MRFGETAAAWLASRHDVADGTLAGFRQVVGDLPAWLAASDPHEVTHLDVQRFVAQLAERMKPNTIRRHIVVVRQVLDYAGVSVNPASDRRVRLPRGERREYRIPTRAQLAEIHDRLPARVPLLILLEHTGLRIEEAAALRWQDIDHARARLLIADAKTPAGRRWVEHLAGCPPFPVAPVGAAPRGLVFATPSASSLTGSLAFAHQRYGTFMLSAHDLRHLHASRLLHDGILSPAQIAARLGHANPGITLGTYSHVVPPD